MLAIALVRVHRADLHDARRAYTVYCGGLTRTRDEYRPQLSAGIYDLPVDGLIRRQHEHDRLRRTPDRHIDRTGGCASTLSYPQPSHSLSSHFGVRMSDRAKWMPFSKSRRYTPFCHAVVEVAQWDSRAPRRTRRTCLSATTEGSLSAQPAVGPTGVLSRCPAASAPAAPSACSAGDTGPVRVRARCKGPPPAR
jgi:hypothetical protein